ncbi:hypothetical protein Q8F55_002882 [Vanrija albida]|uniref:Nucleoporin Nup133/Nup155-like C-terminal domain-containing protein n=1 Tax=Vanrija albida TaxID=181172 RepID=A0ABR3QAZ6_9TREE
MFNTPARAPRRGARGRESVARGSLFSAESTPAPSLRPSRLRSSESQLSPSRSEAESARTPRAERTATADDWEAQRVFWSKDERHAVVAAGALPTEAAAVVAEADFIVAQVSASVDPASGFALVATPKAALAWNYAKRTHSSPTVYSFPAPPLAYTTGLEAEPPVLAAFYSAPSEPGLVLVSATGEVRFWESMSLALANAQRFQSVQLQLGGDGVYAEKLWKLDASTFVVTTTVSSAWLIRIAPVGGLLVPTTTQFTRSSGLFGRSSPAIFNDNTERWGIAAVTASAAGVHLLGRSTLQQWSVGPDGSVRLVHEFDLRESIGKSLFDDERVWNSGNVHLELNDLVSVGSGQLGALVSYSQPQSGSSEYNRRSYNSHAVVLFENNVRSNTVTLNNIVYLSYVAHPDPRTLDAPRLYIPAGSQTVFVRFAEAIVMASLSSNAYEDSVKLRANNAFIGIGAGAARKGGVSSIVAMAATGGLMTIEVAEGVVSNRNLSSAASATAAIRSRMEQAVFFGDRGDNPLTFDLPAGYRGDVAEAAEAVSIEIVSSSSPNLPAIYEIRALLTDRLNRLQELMDFIHRNHALSLLPESTRRRLCSHAEKVAAAIDLWDYQNGVMDQVYSRSPQSLLADSITILMEQLGAGSQDDIVRLFFRKHVLQLDRLLDTVFQSFKAVSSTGVDLSEWVLEANRIFLIVLTACTLVREHGINIYQVDRTHPAVALWTASDTIINDVEALYIATEKLIKQRTRTLGSVVDEAAPTTGAAANTEQAVQQRNQDLLKQQMTSLAAALCDNTEDKLRTSATEMSGGADPTSGLTLGQRWAELKPRVIRPLVDIDRVDAAYELAEHHRDFPTLVYLCQNPASSAGPGRIEQYIERFGKDFAFVLYQWYIDNGQVYTLLSQDEVYGSLLSAFFQQFPHPELSWLHDIASKRYGDAAAALFEVDRGTIDLDQKHILSSIAKLSAVAEIKSRGDNEERTRLLESIDDELDIINVENALQDAIVLAAPTTGYPKQPSAEGYVAENAKVLVQRPAYTRLLTQLISRLLAGDALDVEGLVDVLTLKDNIGGRERDAAIALERLVADNDLPEARKQVALISVWRRVFIRDDWAQIAQTSGRSEEAQRQLQRQTLTYQTLLAIREARAEIPPSFILSPKTAAQAPQAVEIAARFPELAAGAVDELLADAQDEIETLDNLIANVGLDERVRAVSELVDADLGSDDVDM